jgi:TRAP-type uncharacterized transport system substrate-binding protein
MSEKDAYNIVKTVFEKRDDLIAVHKEAANFKLENQKADGHADSLPPWRGKYFAERGIKIN